MSEDVVPFLLVCSARALSNGCKSRSRKKTTSFSSYSIPSFGGCSC